jgi:RNA polymerase sigma-70 factor, ECF subfamily
MAAATVQPSMIPAATEDAGEAERHTILRARAGDEDAFRALMDAHRDHAFAIALRITRSRQDAEDVVQQAFVRAWHALGQFRADSAFGTWMHRIVARNALDRASQLKTRREREDDLDAANTALAFSAHEPRDVLLVRRLEALMRSLSAAQRAVVTLFYWEETPVDEIAATLGMPENTVKTHLSRARAALREAWLRTEGQR